MSEGALDLSEESLIATARERTGLTDFGDESFREGLRVLLETYERAGLRPGGRKVTRGRLIQLLCNRVGIIRNGKMILQERVDTLLTGSARLGILPVFGLFILGLLLLRWTVYGSGYGYVHKFVTIRTCKVGYLSITQSFLLLGMRWILYNFYYRKIKVIFHHRRRRRRPRHA